MTEESGKAAPPAGIPGAPLPTQAFLAVLRLSSGFLAAVGAVFAEHGITAARFDALDALKRLGRPARPSELKDLLHLPAQTLTGTLDALEAAGHLRRLPHPSDRRSVLVEITPAGTELIARLIPPLEALEAELLSPLTPKEQAKLVKLAGKLQAGAPRAEAGPRNPS